MADLTAGSPALNATFETPEGERLGTRNVLSASGGRPTLLVFFKTTCPVCQLDWPYLERLHRAHGTALRVVGVSQDDAASSRRYYEAYGKATFDLLLDPGPAYAASNAYGVEAVPHHVLVAPDGKVTNVFAGWNRRAIEELDHTYAAEGEAKPGRVVPKGDPVPSFKPG